VVWGMGEERRKEVRAVVVQVVVHVVQSVVLAGSVSRYGGGCVCTGRCFRAGLPKGAKRGVRRGGCITRMVGPWLCEVRLRLGRVGGG
jgi:hypothetical protein